MNFSPRTFEAVKIWRTGSGLRPAFGYAVPAGFALAGASGIAPARFRSGSILGRKTSLLKSVRRVVRRFVLFPSALRGGWGTVQAALPALALCVLCILPIWMASAHNEALRQWFSNSAYAAILPANRGTAEHGMSVAERRRLSAPIRAVLASDSDRLVGMGSHDVALAFPQPELQREEGGVMIWQYRVGRCVVDVYFGPLAEGADDRKVIYYETRARGKAVLGAMAAEAEGADSSLSGCLQTVMTEPREFPVAAFAAAMR